MNVLNSNTKINNYILIYSGLMLLFVIKYPELTKTIVENQFPNFFPQGSLCATRNIAECGSSAAKLPLSVLLEEARVKRFSTKRTLERQ